MRAASPRTSFRLLLLAIAALGALALGGCAGMAARDPIRMHVAGLEPIQGQGLELRFNVRLRLQNLGETAVEFDGIALELELNERPFATGVSDRKGTVPRFGETMIDIPATVSALSAVRQVLGVVGGGPPENIPYVLRARLAAGPLGVTTVTESGTLNLPFVGKAGN